MHARMCVCNRAWDISLCGVNFQTFYTAVCQRQKLKSHAFYCSLRQRGILYSVLSWSTHIRWYFKSGHTAAITAPLIVSSSTLPSQMILCSPITSQTSFCSLLDRRSPSISPPCSNCLCLAPFTWLLSCPPCPLSPPSWCSSGFLPQLEGRCRWTAVYSDKPGLWSGELCLRELLNYLCGRLRLCGESQDYLQEKHEKLDNMKMKHAKYEKLENMKNIKNIEKKYEKAWDTIQNNNHEKR